MTRTIPKVRTVVVAVVGLTMLPVPVPTSAIGSPAAPTALAAGFGPNNLVLTWTDNASDETGFSVERCGGSNCTAFGRIGTVGAGTTSYVDLFHASGANRYRVRALNAVGYSPYSNTAEIVMVSGNEVFPSIVSAPTVGVAPLVVGFDGRASSVLNGTITSYVWSFGDDQTSSGAVVTHTYAGPGVYAASLMVTSSAFGATDSAAVSITVMPPPLVAPGDLSATSPTRGQIRLTWTNPVSSATSLALERCRGSGCTSFSQIARLTALSTSYVDSAVKRGSTYRYRLAASGATATVYSNTTVAVAR